MPFATPPATLPLPGSSHEPATLGSVFVYLAFVLPLWPGCPASGVDHCSPQCELVQCSYLRTRTLEATVATWKTSRKTSLTLRSGGWEDHPTQDMAPTCPASSAWLMCNSSLGVARPACMSRLQPSSTTLALGQNS